MFGWLGHSILKLFHSAITDFSIILSHSRSGSSSLCSTITLINSVLAQVSLWCEVKRRQTILSSLHWRYLNLGWWLMPVIFTPWYINFFNFLRLLLRYIFKDLILNLLHFNRLSLLHLSLLFNLNDAHIASLDLLKLIFKLWVSFTLLANDRYFVSLTQRVILRWFNWRLSVNDAFLFLIRLSRVEKFIGVNTLLYGVLNEEVV